MEQVKNVVDAIAQFDDLNVRMHALIDTAVKEVVGTPDERKFMTTLTEAGIESGNELIGLIEKGLTQEIWVNYLTEKNSIDGPLGLAENEAGEMAALIKELHAMDLKALFDGFVASGVFEIDVVRANVEGMAARLEFMKTVWAEEDEQVQAVTK